MFVSILIFFFITLSVFALMDTGEKKSAHTEYIYWGAVFVMFLLAALRPIGVDNDSSAYQNLFINGAQRENEIEFSFEIIGNWVYNVWKEPRMLFVIYAILSVSICAVAIKITAKETKILSLLVWASYFYIIHVLTEIRVAVAAGLFVLALLCLVKGKKLQYIMLILLAIYFHYSSIILLPLVFLSNNSMGNIWKWVLYFLPIFGYFFYFIHFDPLVSLPIPYMQDKIEIYEALRDEGISGEEINVFNIVYLIKLFIYYIVLWKTKHIESHKPEVCLVLKIYAISYFCFAFFAFLPVLSFRISDLIGIVEIFIIPYLIYVIKPQFVGRLIVVVYSVITLLIGIFYNNLLDTTM